MTDQEVVIYFEENSVRRVLTAEEVASGRFLQDSNYTIANITLTATTSYGKKSHTIVHMACVFLGANANAYGYLQNMITQLVRKMGMNGWEIRQDLRPKWTR